MEIMKSAFMNITYRELNRMLRELENFIKDSLDQAYEKGYENAEFDRMEEMVREAVNRIVGNKKGEGKDGAEELPTL